MGCQCTQGFWGGIPVFTLSKSDMALVVTTCSQGAALFYLESLDTLPGYPTWVIPTSHTQTLASSSIWFRHFRSRYRFDPSSQTQTWNSKWWSIWKKLMKWTFAEGIRHFWVVIILHQRTCETLTKSGFVLTPHSVTLYHYLSLVTAPSSNCCYKPFLPVPHRLRKSFNKKYCFHSKIRNLF